jgi:hypothetical protein
MSFGERPRAPLGISVEKPTCLYYPYFSMRDIEWTKKALLFWDTIATIVPKSVDVTDLPDPHFHALMNAGVVQPWAVSTEVREDVADSALTMIDEGVHLQFPEGEDFTVNFGKLTHRLRHELTDRGHVVKSYEHQLTLDHRVAMMILTLLAHRLAELTNAQPLTDDSDLASRYVHIGHGASRGSSALQILERDLALAIPDLQDIELDKWLRFREDNRAALELYRVGLRKLARDLTHAREEAEADEILLDRQEDLASKMDDRKAIFRRLTSDNTWMTLRLVFEVGATAPASPELAAALVGLEGAAFVARKFRRKELHHLSFVQEAASKFG